MPERERESERAMETLLSNMGQTALFNSLKKDWGPFKEINEQRLNT